MAEMGNLKEETAPLVAGNTSTKSVSKMKLFMGAAAVGVLAVVGIVVAVVLVTGAKDKNDIVVFNANIHTMDPRHPTATAFSVRDSKIKEIGSKEELFRKYKHAKVVDAGGAFLMPGFNDAHGRLLTLGASMLEVRLDGCSPVEECVDRMVAYVEEHGLEDGSFLLGRGWDQNDFPGEDPPFPTRQDIDARLPDIPVWVTRTDGHTAWANTAAMDLADIPDEDPPGGTIVRDEHGEATGVFLDSAMYIIDAVVPPPTDAYRREALNLAITTLHSLGVTSIHDGGITPEDVEFYKQAVDDDRLDLRIYAMLLCPNGTFCADTVEQVHHYGDRWTMRSTKIYMDGTLGSWSAALLQPYSDRPDESGLILTPVEEYEELVDLWLRAGWQVNSHGIGDRANRIIIDTMTAAIAEDAQRGGPGPASRHRIEHAQVVSLDDIPRMKEPGLIPSMQPTHAPSDMGFVASRLGTEEESDRILGSYAWRRMLDNAGEYIALGSGFPVESPNPMKGVYAALTRQDEDGFPEGGWFPAERLSIDQTLKGFTTDGAYARHAEDMLGSITRGKFADFVLWDTDLTTADPQRVLEAKALATFFGGEKVYGDALYAPVERSD